MSKKTAVSNQIDCDVLVDCDVTLLIKLLKTKNDFMFRTNSSLRLGAVHKGRPHKITNTLSPPPS